MTFCQFEATEGGFGLAKFRRNQAVKLSFPKGRNFESESFHTAYLIDVMGGRRVRLRVSRARRRRAHFERGARILLHSHVIAKAKHQDDIDKVELLCEAAGLGMRPVPDPYYGGDEEFKNIFDLVKTACHRIAEQWKGNHE